MLAGELSPAVAWVLILGLAVAGTAIAAVNFGPLISSLYAFGLFLGTVYSIPPFRCDARTGFRVQTTIIPAGLQAIGLRGTRAPQVHRDADPHCLVVLCGAG